MPKVKEKKDHKVINKSYRQSTPKKINSKKNLSKEINQNSFSIELNQSNIIQNKAFDNPKELLSYLLNITLNKKLTKLEKDNNEKENDLKLIKKTYDEFYKSLSQFNKSISQKKNKNNNKKSFIEKEKIFL